MPRKKICDAEIVVPMSKRMKKAVDIKATSQDEYMSTYIKGLIKKDLKVKELK